MVKRLPYNILVEFTRLMNERTAEGSAVARGQPQTDGKKAAKVGKTERCLGTMEYRSVRMKLTASSIRR